MDLESVKNLAVAFEGDSSVGRDVAADDDFNALKDEIGKGEGLDIQPIDWGKVAQLAQKVLSEQSKDLRAANYLCVALYYEHGFDGLAKGFSMLESFARAEYWDEIYPQRKKRANKGRAATFEWTIKKLERPFAELELKPDDLAGAVASGKAFNSLDNALADRLENDAPNLFEFRNVIGRYKQEAEFLLAEAESRQKESEEAEAKKAAEAEAKQAQPAQESAASQSQPAQTVQAETVQEQSEAATPVVEQQSTSAAQTNSEPTQQTQPVAIEAKPVPVASTADIEKALRSNLQTVEKIARMLREQKVSNPYPYHILRASAWMLLERLPEPGVLPQLPNIARIKNLQQLEHAKNWEMLINECEKSFAGGAIYWLGTHRLVANALTALGATDAAKTVKDSVANLLARFPDYMEYTFASGDGFADEMTKAWIETEVMTAEAVETDAASSGESIAPWKEAAKDAKKLAVGGEFNEGILLFRQGIQSVTNERDATHWMLEQARFCFDAGHLDVAMPQLQHLYNTLQNKGLERWEPELNLAVVRLLLACHEKRQAKQKYTKEQLEQVDTLRTQLCLMDPVGALSLK